MDSVRTMWRGGSVAVAVGAIALPVVAEAAPVIYSTPQTDGTVNFTPSTGTVGPSATLQFTIGGGGITSSSNGLVEVAGGFATKYSSGTVIDASVFSNPQPGGGLGLSKDGNSYFIALETSDPSAPDNIYYGYAEIEGSFAFTGPTYIIDSYAFETLPNTGITTQEAAAAVPEPSSLSLLALGAAGVTLYRRRRATH